MLAATILRHIAVLLLPHHILSAVQARHSYYNLISALFKSAKNKQAGTTKVQLLNKLRVRIVNYNSKHFRCTKGAMCVYCYREAKEQSNAYKPKKNLLL
jgi:hypothetical protein